MLGVSTVSFCTTSWLVPSLREEELRLVRSYAFCVDKSVSAVFAELAGSSAPYQERGSL